MRIVFVTKKPGTPLRLYVDPSADSGRPAVADFAHLERLCRSFEHATGWALSLARGAMGPKTSKTLWSAPIAAGAAQSPGYLVVSSSKIDSPATRPPADPDAVRDLAEGIRGLLGELHRVRYALWQREAELAAGVPLVPHRDEEGHLALRLEAVLKGGAEAVNCQAAGLYLLDEATKELKLRAVWGLPKYRLAEPARPLAEAVADLEALTGHAVVLEDARLLPHWNVPEDYAAAVCVPVSTPRIPLGTLWIFSETRRDFTEKETNLIEIIAGRLASDLEREILLGAAVDDKRRARKTASDAETGKDRFPQVAPVLEGWDMAAGIGGAEDADAAIYHWFVLDDGSLTVTAGQAHVTGPRAALWATALSAAVRSHALYPHDAGEMMRQVGDTLWSGSAGDRAASLFYAIIAPETGKTRYAAAGGMSAWILRPHGADPLAEPDPALGSDAEIEYRQHEQVIAAGDVLIVAGGASGKPSAGQTRPMVAGPIARTLRRHLDQPAEKMVQMLRRHLTGAILVVKRHRRWR